jgi:Histidine kinase-, DNA gyrase B-, and HSP90-like ATPase
MEDLSLHILDVVENGTAAGASLVEIRITEDSPADRLEIQIKDNGRGMDAAMAASVTDPFVTTRTTRRVGLGLPLLKMAAEETGGDLTLTSELGVGTEVVASFQSSHIDRKPLGDVAGTMVALIIGNPEIDFVFEYRQNGDLLELDTRELKEQLGDEVPISNPAVLNMIREHLSGAGDDNEGEDNG